MTSPPQQRKGFGGWGIKKRKKSIVQMEIFKSKSYRDKTPENLLQFFWVCYTKSIHCDSKSEPSSPLRQSKEKVCVWQREVRKPLSFLSFLNLVNHTGKFVINALLFLNEEDWHQNITAFVIKGCITFGVLMCKCNSNMHEYTQAYK